MGLPDNLPESLRSVPIIDLTARLPVNPKYTWESLKGKRDVNALTTIVFHHDALSKSRTSGLSDEQLARNIATSHINSQRNIAGGDPGFPYHAWIRNGKIYVANQITDFTYGVASNNGYTVHICVSGEYAAADSLTDQDRNALYACFLLYKSAMPKYSRAVGHKELSATSCPGYDMSKVRSDLEAIQLAAEVTNTPNDTMAKVYSTKTRLDDLYKTATGTTKYNELAQKYLLKIGEFMKKEGIL